MASESVGPRATRIWTADPLLRAQADAAARELGLETVLRAEHNSSDDLLVLAADGWTLRDSEGRRLHVDFDENKVDYARTIPRGMKEPLARALGGDKGLRRVWDLSAGLGIDAVFLSRLGFKVTAFERDPVTAFLLRDARERTRRPELQSLEFINADSREKLAQLQSADGIEAIYFDPMYPHRRKSALSRQEMELFRRRIGDDPDAAEVLNAALAAPVRRVVVKRPLRAEPLAGKPTSKLEGTTVRFDIYARLS